MSPAGQEVSEEVSLSPRLFMQRLIHEVPSLQDALTLYNTTKVSTDHHTQKKKISEQFFEIYCAI